MRLASIPHRHKFLFLSLGALALVLVGIIVGFVVLLSGSYSTAATKQHFAITYKILDVGLRYSVRTAAADIVPPDLNGVDMIREGFVCYRAHCEQCHGAPGVARGDAGKGMLPAPTSLTQSAMEWPAAHLYYVTKYGIRMTGMPAWTLRMSESGLWSTVAFLKHMPRLSSQEYEQWAASTGQGACPRNTEAAPVYTRERGQMVLRQYACENCHRIDDLVGPDTHIGPPLTQWSKRKYIAGVLPNTRENLVRWIVAPHEVSPATLMPDLGVPPAHAREMAAYLFESE
jgi:mono/diheme cytochrome c family protein